MLSIPNKFYYIAHACKILLLSVCFLFLPYIAKTPSHVYAAVVINELYPKPTDEQSEWVELFNTGEESVSLNLWKLENTEGEKKTFIINASAIIQPHAFLVFPKSQTGISMRNDGDTIRLIDQNNTTVDTQSFLGILGFNTSVGRTIDGAGVWSMCTTSTYEAKNTCPEPSATPSPLVTNSPLPIVPEQSSPTPTIFTPPVDTPTPIVEVVYVTRIPTPTPTTTETLTIQLPKTVGMQIVIIAVAWALIAAVAVHNKNKNKHPKKLPHPKGPQSPTEN